MDKGDYFEQHIQQIAGMKKKTTVTTTIKVTPIIHL